MSPHAKEFECLVTNEMKTGPNHKPPLPPSATSMYRGKDPWHRDAFPSEFKDYAPVQTAERISGWFLTDHWGNEIGFIPDGTTL